MLASYVTFSSLFYSRASCTYRWTAPIGYKPPVQFLGFLISYLPKHLCIAITIVIHNQNGDNTDNSCITNFLAFKEATVEVVKNCLWRKTRVSTETPLRHKGDRTSLQFAETRKRCFFGHTELAVRIEFNFSEHLHTILLACVFISPPPSPNKLGLPWFQIHSTAVS